MYYLSGQISDLPLNRARENFIRAEQAVYFEIKGNTFIMADPTVYLEIQEIIVNPIRLYEKLKRSLRREPLYKEIMGKCLKSLFECSDIVMLPNWKYSKGATAEFHLAQALNINVHFLTDNYTFSTDRI